MRSRFALCLTEPTLAGRCIHPGLVFAFGGEVLSGAMAILILACLSWQCSSSQAQSQAVTVQPFGMSYPLQSLSGCHPLPHHSLPAHWLGTIVQWSQ